MSITNWSKKKVSDKKEAYKYINYCYDNLQRKCKKEDKNAYTTKKWKSRMRLEKPYNSIAR